MCETVSHILFPRYCPQTEQHFNSSGMNAIVWGYQTALSGKESKFINLRILHMADLFGQSLDSQRWFPMCDHEALLAGHPRTIQKKELKFIQKIQVTSLYSLSSEFNYHRSRLDICVYTFYIFIYWCKLCASSTKEVKEYFIF